MSDGDFNSSNDVMSGTLEGILDTHSYQAQRKVKNMAAPQILPRALAGRGGNNSNRTGLANEDQPGGMSPGILEALNTLLVALGTDPITPDMPEADVVAMLQGLAHGVEGAGDDPQMTAAGMSNSPRQRVAAMAHEESRLSIAKRISARTGRPVAEVLKYVP